MTGEEVHIQDVVEDNRSVTVIVDDPEFEQAVIYSLDAADPGALEKIREIERNSHPDAAVMSYFGLKFVLENKTV